MFLISKKWLMVAAVGQGVLLSLAFIGEVRIVCLLLGMTLPDSIAGNLFLVSSPLTGAVTGYLYVRSLNRAKSKASAVAPLGDRE